MSQFIAITVIIISITSPNTHPAVMTCIYYPGNKFLQRPQTDVERRRKVLRSRKVAAKMHSAERKVSEELEKLNDVTLPV